jgi:hypothetical protein
MNKIKKIKILEIESMINVMNIIDKIIEEDEF